MLDALPVLSLLQRYSLIAYSATLLCHNCEMVLEDFTHLWLCHPPSALKWSHHTTFSELLSLFKDSLLLKIRKHYSSRSSSPPSALLADLSGLSCWSPDFSDSQLTLLNL